MHVLAGARDSREKDITSAISPKVVAELASTMAMGNLRRCPGRAGQELCRWGKSSPARGNVNEKGKGEVQGETSKRESYSDQSVNPDKCQ